MAVYRAKTDDRDRVVGTTAPSRAGRAAVQTG
jgi:hypothetical protein